jgi:acyl-coenzyme A synthetase/AMP-(fatty) acid ligase
VNELKKFTSFARFKAPRSVTFVNELPKTATGKIQKYVLRTQRRAIAPHGVNFPALFCAWDHARCAFFRLC